MSDAPLDHVPLWDMLGPRLPRGILGASDPHVTRADGRWEMLVGVFSTSFRNRIHRAVLADGADPRTGWVLDRRPIVADPQRGAWDVGGMHTPCRVPAAHGQPERIAYAGRASARHFGAGSGYAIGVLDRDGDGWVRRDEPVLRGWPGRASVLEPLVIATDVGFRMWCLATPHEVGRGEQPDFALMVADSVDGLAWQHPRPFASSSEGFFDAAIDRVGDTWELVLARGTNLHGTQPYPAQGLWRMRAHQPSGDRADWSVPERILDTDAPGTPGWMARGVCGPSVVRLDDGRRLAFLTGTHDAGSWIEAARRRFAAARRLPVPSPYFLATGSIRLPD